MKRIILYKVFALVLVTYNLVFPQHVFVSSNGNSFRVHFDIPQSEYTITQHGKYQLVEFSHYSDSNQLYMPYKELVFAIPPYTQPDISIEIESVNLMKNSLPGSGNGKKSVFNVSSQKFFNNKPTMEVIGYFWFREFYCVKIRVNTHSFNEKECSITEINKFNIELKFNSEIKITESSQLKYISKFDELLRSLLSNYEIAEQFRSSPDFTIDDSSGNWIDYRKTYIKLSTAADALVRLKKSDLDTAISDINSIDPKTFKLYESGREVPIYVYGESDGRFDDDDYIDFWGTKNYNNRYREINTSNEDYNNYVNKYTDTTFYFLTWGGTPGKRAKIAESYDNSISDTLNYYLDKRHIENNTMFQFMNNDEIQNQMPNYHKNKSWVWNWIFASTYNYNFSAPGLISDKTCNVFFKIISTASNQSANSHTVKLSLNGIKLDSQVVNRYNQALLHGSLNSYFLNPDKNTISVQNFSNGTSPNQIALDWYEYEYPRTLVLTNDSLYFQMGSDFIPGIKIIKIGNVSDSDYEIYKVKPYLKKIKLFHNSSSFLFFTDTVKSGDAYIIIRASKLTAPVIIYSTQLASLREDHKQTDYIGITHNDFWTASQNYLNELSDIYSLNSELVNIRDIFDQFGYGYPQPEAIKRFLKYSFDNRISPKPSYVCLIGDGNYDFHKYFYKYAGVKGGGNYIPSYGIPVSDNWFVVWDENTLPIPQMKLGRLPINKASELDWYLSKIKNNSTALFDKWNKRFLLFSGGNPQKPEETKLLKAVNDSILNKYISPQPVSGNYFHFYKTLSPPSDFGPYSPAQVNSAISDGGMLISYIGHSGTATWDNSISEVDQLKNSLNRTPLITDFGCSTNKFAEPDIISFGERFVLSPMGQAIGYIGNSSFGFISTSTTVPLLFYESIFKDSIYEIGSAHVLTKIKMFEKTGMTNVNKIFSLTNMIIGDPAVQLRIANMPNLYISQSDMNIGEKNISAVLDSIPIRIKYFNLGIAKSSSLVINCTHYYNSNKISERFQNVQLPDFCDSLIFWLKIKDLPGTHTISITLDTDNRIKEIYENDNNVQFNFVVFSSDIRDLLTNRIENGTIKEIVFLNPSIVHDHAFKILFEYSKSPDFTLSYWQDLDPQTYYTKLKCSIFDQNERYWFRTKLNQNGALFSETKSLYYGGSAKFLLNDSISFAAQNQKGVEFDKTDLHLSTDSIKISVISAGWYSGSNCIIAKENTNLLSNTYFAGIGTVVFDPVTMEIDTTQWYTLFGQPANVIQLTKLINSIPPGKIVAMGVSDDAANNMSTDLKTAIKTLGSTMIDQLKFRGSWALIGKKGAKAGEAIEEVKGPYEGNIYLDSVFVIRNSSGTLTTKNIGPASKWKNLQLSFAKPADSEIGILINGIKKDGRIDSLKYFEVMDPTTNIDSIDAGEYNFLQLKTKLKAASDGSSPSVSRLGVDFTGVPELGTNYQVVSVSRDTLVQGDSLNLGFYVYNVGESPADSFRVKIELIKPDNTSKLLMDSLAARIDTVSRKYYSILYRTVFSDGIGNMKFKINLDPENKITELYKDNNIYEASFYVKPDSNPTSVTSASLDVTFDGINITEGDYVSSNPEVKFIFNYPVWFPVSDTSSIKFYLDNKLVYHSQLDFFSDTINRKAVFKFLPTLDNGEHYLRVYGKNVIGKIENTPGYQMLFQVQTELKLINVYNYPNPFKESTYFIFTLTRIPDDLRIKIYTVAGRLIKEINGNFFAPHSGYNSIPWDGLDNDGNIIANGVYLYKIIAKNRERSDEIIQKLAIVR